MPKALKIAAAVMVALASAAIGWFGVKWYQDSKPAASPPVSASPSPTTTAVAYVHLTFNLTELIGAGKRPHSAPAVRRHVVRRSRESRTA